MDKLKTCAFSGHRPGLLPWGYSENDERCLNLKGQIREQIITAINKGYAHYFSGMALGCDIFFAQLVLELKKDYPDIKLICAIPYELQYSNWKKSDKERYFNILRQCDHKEIISLKYTESCFMDRNKYMIDNASLLIAVYNGFGKSGTRNTIKYAQKTGIDIVIINV